MSNSDSGYNKVGWKRNNLQLNLEQQSWNRLYVDFFYIMQYYKCIFS